MSNIVPKLNLNKTPNLVDTNSLVFAKNIRVDIDGSLHKDYGIKPFLGIDDAGDVCDYRTIIYKILNDFDDIINDETISQNEKVITTTYKTIVENILKQINNNNPSILHIIDVIPYNDEFYCLFNAITKYTIEGKETYKTNDFIFCYKEKEDKFYPCDTAWSYHYGKIEGCILNNIVGEKILVIAEYDTDEKVPLKCINLSKASSTDDESIYTQMPIIPITNLNYSGTFNYVIPNGSYQFFIRYKIRDNFYTDWFPASKEVFTGNTNNVITNFGTLKYVNTHTDSDNSFVFNVEHLNIENTKYYKKFQIGFICSHDDTIVARAWKHFDINTQVIQFDYKTEDGEEIEVTDLTKVSYNIYNVGNVTSFKNKVYISNYEESNLNEQFQNIANKVNITIKEKSEFNGYDKWNTANTTIGNKTYITAINNIPIAYAGTEKDSIIKNLINNITSILSESTNNNQTENNYYDSSVNKTSIYGTDIRLTRDNLSTLQNNIIARLKQLGENKAVGNIKFDTDVDYISIDDKTVSTSTDSANANINKAIDVIYNTIKGINDNGTFVNNSYLTKNTFTIRIWRNYNYTVTVNNPGTIIDKEINPDISIQNIDDINNTGTAFKTITESYEQKIIINLIAYKNKISNNNVSKLTSYTTLIPFQHYKFYIHFVKNNGEITNGYYCGGDNAGEIIPEYKASCNTIIYPSFININIPDGYSACFFSIFHNAIDSATIYDVQALKNSTTVLCYEGSCLDIDLRLVPGYKNINIKYQDTILNVEGETTTTEIKDTTGDYYYSSNSTYGRYFGARGIIKINNTSPNINGLMYVTTDYEFSQIDNIKLVKCTPFINDTIFDDYNDLDLQGYICEISPLDKNRSINYYSDGSSVWKKQNIDDLNNTNNTIHISLDELGKYNDSTAKIADFDLMTTNKVYIYSNYNLNYLSLSSEPIQVNKTYYNTNSDGKITDDVTKIIIWRLLTSLTLSEVYKLDSMYKNTTRKIYSVYNENDVVRFDNTIRSSKLESDESRINVFKFDPDDYYNVPTNRGIITNLKGIGDNIIVHTKDSMFKFTGSNNLQSSTGEIQPTETDVFQTGISEVFGSDFGYAGLQNKQNSIITETGYIFYDKDSNVIYMYSGQGQIIKLSDNIERLFNHAPVEDVRFANDYYNNRIFICIWFKYNNGLKPVTLSFYLNQNNRNFISLHDFYFTKAFNTKVNCYFLNNRETNICKIDKSDFNRYMGITIENSDDIYPRSVEFDKEEFKIYRNDGGDYDNIELDVANIDSIIDIIYNVNYETVKTLNSISWYSKIIKDVFPLATNMVYENMAESIDTDIPAMQIMIYTDTCCSDIIHADIKSNDYSIKNPNSYQLPRYNQGYWSLSYFRNIINNNNAFKYLDNYNDGRKKASFINDENSLIEGKYFVVRFIFRAGKDFKLESINFNYSNKL